MYGDAYLAWESTLDDIRYLTGVSPAIITSSTRLDDNGLNAPDYTWNRRQCTCL